MSSDQNEGSGPGFDKEESDLIIDIQRMLGVARLEDALSLAREFAERRPDSAAGWLCLGLALRKSRAHRRAIKSFDRALAVDPGLIDAWLGRSLCNAILGNVKEALDDARTILGVDPANAKGKALSQRLEARAKAEKDVEHMVIRPKVKEEADVEERPAGRSAKGAAEVLVASVEDRAVRPKDGPGERAKDGADVVLQEGHDEGARDGQMARSGENAVEDVHRPRDLRSSPMKDRSLEVRYISSALAQEVVNRIEDEKESILVLAPKLQTFKASTAVLQALTEMYEMDGVMVCSDRPHDYTARILSRYSGRLDLVQFIDMVSADERMGTVKGTRGPEAARCPVYDLDRFIELMDDGLHRMAVRHGGEEHFVMFDDVSALAYYHSQRSLLRFFEVVSEHLEEHGILLVAVLAKERSGLLSSWTGSAFQAKVTVRPQWLVSGGGFG